ncbi:helix-turn-helix domain-containing protein [Nocardia asteroides]|uniref:helix-turn-helix domain-containing protein n=2 Tax=Nocardia asteroides TaxID=1824 RepID=UPI003986D39C
MVRPADQSQMCPPSQCLYFDVREPNSRRTRPIMMYGKRVAVRKCRSSQSMVPDQASLVQSWNCVATLIPRTDGEGAMNLDSTGSWPRLTSCGASRGSHVRTTADIPELLVRYRVRAKLSQEEVAERAQLSVRALRNIERGRTRYPHVQSVKRLTAALGLDAEEARILLTSVNRPIGSRKPELGGSPTF